MNWRFVNAAVRGTSHELGEKPCQDDCYVDLVTHEDREVLFAIASDGAGSAQCAEEGSGLVCETLLRSVEQWLRDGGTLNALHQDCVERWIVCARSAIEERASQKELTPRDFACTLVAAVVETDAAAFLQIGDGAIVAGRDDQYDVIFWPEGGEYANMTFFTTDDDWTRHLRFEVRAVVINDLVLMTDGLQRLALQFASRTAHVPFFAPMFRALEGAEPGFAADLEPPLVTFLGSAAVNSRTDDDKSLVLATRRSGAHHGAL